MDSTASKRRRTTASPFRSIRTAQTKEQDDDAGGRASYRSPTKASISRFNPQLLSGQAQSEGEDVEEESATGQAQGGTRRLNPTALRPKMTAPRLSASPMRETSSSPSRRAQSNRESIEVRRKSSFGERRRSISEMEDRDEQNAESQVQVEAERSLIEEEKLADSVMRKPKRYRDNITNFAPELLKEQEEPELPPTPVQLGLEKQPQLAGGPVSSSPQERDLRRRAVLKRSPLKLNPEVPEQTAEMEEDRDAPSKQIDGQTSEQVNAGITDRAEEELADDPKLIEQRKKLDDLSKQLKSLRSDVSFLLSQVRQSQGTGKQISQENTHRLVNILTATQEPQEASPLKTTSLATRLSAFLPFSKKPKPLPEDALLEEEILPSYKPVEESNPLVNLQAFTPFTITSTQRLEIVSSGEALYNRQLLQLSSPGPAELDLEFDLLSDTDTDTLVKLSLDSISPWADAELGTWIRQQAEDTADMASVGWGSSRYLEVAKARARCWARCHHDFPQYISSAYNSAIAKASSRPFESHDPLDTETSQYLGRPSLRLQSQRTKASLLIAWHITLDWIGDTESRVSASATLPSRWTKLDSQRKSLTKIPEAFEKLVKKIGVYEAIKAMTDIVLGAES